MFNFRKTLLPNSIIILSLAYFYMLYWGIKNNGNLTAFLFYGILLPILFYLFLKKYLYYGCLLKIEDLKLKVNYFFHKNKYFEYNLFDIKSDITVTRYISNEYVGGLPNWKDFLNFKWYFTINERYKLEFLYKETFTTINFQTNILGLKKFLKNLEQNTNYSYLNITEGQSGMQLAGAVGHILVKIVS